MTEISVTATVSQGTDKLLVHLWCCPRTCSTATIYSFSRRADCHVIDEPLYAHFLAHNPSLFRPYRDELLKSMETDGNIVLKGLDSISEKRVIVVKHMTKFVSGLDKTLYMTGKTIGGRTVKHVFLIRDPLDMIISWGVKTHVHQEECTLQTLSLPDMLQMFSELKNNGLDPIVVDSNLLRLHPKEILGELCHRLAIPYMEEQLSWPAGPKPDIDGLWAPHWYDQVHLSTGFNTVIATPTITSALLAAPEGSDDGAKALQRKAGEPLYPTVTPRQMSVYREALPFFNFLQRHAIGIDPLSPGSSCPPSGSHPYIPAHSDKGDPRLSDPRNADILIWVGDRLLPREAGKVSVLDSAVQGGDAVWEGVRIYSGRVFKLEEHLERLQDSAKAMAFQNIPSRDFIRTCIFRTLAANGMRDSAHIRLTLTRGAKITSSMNPKFNIFGTNLIVLPEWKPVGDPATYDNAKGVSLITATNRRNSPQYVDSKIHHCNLINNILPKIQANYANAADALMLDHEGFVSETNATNVFMVKNGIVLTPHGDSCLPGITRRTIIQIMPDVLGNSVIERRLSLAEFHTADEVFTTGTMGELTPVTLIDGRVIGDTGLPGPITKKIQEYYTTLTLTQGVPLP